MAEAISMAVAVAMELHEDMVVELQINNTQ